MANYEKNVIIERNILFVDKDAKLETESKPVDPKDYSYDLNKVRFSMMWDVTTLFRFFGACNIISDYGNKNNCSPKVIDLGCSTASLAYLYFRSFKAINVPAMFYTGVDWRLETLEKNAKERFRTPTKFVQCDVGKLDLPDECIPADIFIAMEVIEHFEKDGGLRMLKFIFDNLVSGGKLFITSPNTPQSLKDQMGCNNQWPENHVYEWNVTEISEELCRLGFIIEYVWGWAPRTRDVRKSIDMKYDGLFSKMTKIFPSSIVGPFFATMDVDNCRGFMIVCRKS
jgi:ubiquinone/menaquinone biosynthesis C-methylase UbiE